MTKPGAKLAIVSAALSPTAKMSSTYDIAWAPVRYLNYPARSIATTLKPAGLDKSTGLIGGVFGKDPNDARWKDDPGFKEYAAFIAKYMSPADFIDFNAVNGFGAAATLPGGQPEGPRTADAAAEHQDQYLDRQFQSDPPNATRHLQRRELAAIRRRPQRLSEHVLARNSRLFRTRRALFLALNNVGTLLGFSAGGFHAHQ
jgi:hypothetical protein